MSDELTELFPDLAPVLNATVPAGTQSQPDQLATNPEHGGVSTDDLAQYFQSRGWGQPRFQSGQGAPPPSGGVEGVDGGMETVTPPVTPPVAPSTTPPNPVEGTQPPAQGTAGTVPSPAVPAAPAPAPAPPSTIDFNGQQISSDRLQALLQFDELVQSDPGLQQRLREHFASQVGGGTGVPAGVAPVPPAQPAPSQSPSGFVPPTPPDDLDLDDPSVRALWDMHVASQQELFNRLQTVEQFSQFTAEQVLAEQRIQTEQMVEAGVQNFKAAKNLSDDEVNHLRQAAARLNVLDSLMSGVDPLTGTPFIPNLTTAAARALEIAYYNVPEYRQRELTMIQEQQKQDAIRKQKLAGVAGTSGSSPRTPAQTPRNEAERRAAMVEAVAAMQNGTYTEGN